MRTRQFSLLRVARLPLVVALVLVVVEAALRIDVVEDALPAATHYYDTAIPKRLDALSHVQEQYGRVDVLFVGSSVVRTNISPMEFDRQLRARANADLVSFNGGLSGLWPAATAVYVREFWLEKARPRVLVEGIRFPELRATTFSIGDRFEKGTIEQAWLADTPLSRLRWRTVDRVRVLQYRGLFGQWLRGFSRGRQGEFDDSRWAIDSRGFTERLPTLDVVKARGLLGNEQPHIGECGPETCRFGFEAVRQTFDACRRAGVVYVLVNMPEHGYRWSGPQGRELYRGYLESLQRFAAANGLDFVDPTDGDPSRFYDDREFSDYHHMSPAGARRFTRMLARYVAERRLPAVDNALHLRGGHPMSAKTSVSETGAVR